MTSTTKTSPLSWKLKIFLAYLYLGLVGSALTILTFSFASDQILKNSDVPYTLTSRLTIIIISIIIAALYGWILYLLHKRKSHTAHAFIILLIVSNGLDPIQPHHDGVVSLATLSAIIFIIIDIAITLFLLESREAKSQLKNMGWL